MEQIQSRSNYFYCYSCLMKDFIKSQGLKYITKGLHPKSGRPYFMFEKSLELDKEIVKWNELKVANISN